MKKRRVEYLIYFLAMLFIEVLIALFVHDKWIRPYVGDILVVVVLYFFVRIFIPTGVKIIPLYIFLFATGVEILQYFELVERLNLENHTFFRILIGSVFDIKDIICYGIGCMLIVVFGWIKKNKRYRLC